VSELLSGYLVCSFAFTLSICLCVSLFVNWHDWNGCLLLLLLLFLLLVSALTLLVGRQEGHPACKNRVVGCQCGCLSGARCRLAYGPADATALTLASVKCRLVLPFWYRLTRVVPEKGPLNVCVCVCVCVRVCVCVCYYYSGPTQPPSLLPCMRQRCKCRYGLFHVWIINVSVALNGVIHVSR